MANVYRLPRELRDQRRRPCIRTRTDDYFENGPFYDSEVPRKRRRTNLVTEDHTLGSAPLGCSRRCTKMSSVEIGKGNLFGGRVHVDPSDS
eukprot:1394444-Amorphochlora_amoeboformis.AAC.3